MALKSSSGIDKDRADSRSEHSGIMVGGTIAFRDRRVPAHVASGSGPAQLDSVSHVMRIAMHSAASSSLPAINGCAL
jgi:hypothetical protein